MRFKSCPLCLVVGGDKVSSSFLQDQSLEPVLGFGVLGISIAFPPTLFCPFEPSGRHKKVGLRSSGEKKPVKPSAGVRQGRSLRTATEPLPFGSGHWHGGNSLACSNTCSIASGEMIHVGF